MNIEQIEPGKILDIHARVLRIRRFEEQVGLLFSQGQLPGFVHLYVGEEAIAAGVCASLRDDDYIVSTHRGHGHVIAKGGNLDRMMAELFGKSEGYCKGKGGSMHIADFDIGILGACGIVGGGIPIAAGAAFSAHYRQTNQVAVSFFGDGAANEGSFHESLNLASTLRLPAVFVCENNQYGEFTPAERAMNIRNIADRAAGYGIEGIVADGSDALAMYDVAVRAVAKARDGGGPTLIEAKTHRRGDHAEGEAAFLGGQEYRPESERLAAAERDPLVSLEAMIVSRGISSAEDLEKVDAETRSAIANAIEFARKSPDPDHETVLSDMWV